MLWSNEFSHKLFLCNIYFFMLNITKQNFWIKLELQLRKNLITWMNLDTAWKVSLFGVFLVRISLIRTEYWEIRSISSYLVQMRENTDQKNSEYGPFSRSEKQLFEDTLQKGSSVTFTGKHLCSGQDICNIKILHHRYFSVNFTNFFRLFLL